MDLAVAKDHLYLKAEYFKGLNLDDVIFSEESQKLDVGKKCSISLQIAQAVAHLHNQKLAIIHLDIKPENIIFSENADVVKLCDIALSKLNTLNSTLTTFANQNELQPGTPAYQAPEIILNHSPACNSTDVCSLSCIISEVFSEEQVWPLEGDSLKEITELMEKKETLYSFRNMLEDQAIPRVVNVVSRGLKLQQ
ncbi:probable serine/threonine-protein kinase DDB_G0286627 [Mercenaria mercenaria]|uniref:probable serine/threonine-protein kinase DDB_G0286627 n=1 Tax=Mercenaria mercenaria TaxID=6596 RepID=UPI001E1DFF27|nr:probable serine/threonine-protein kinase DDB_G0286627 [Mercenaria mercenaria]